jgi:hypothetical protein
VNTGSFSLKLTLLDDTDTVVEVSSWASPCRRGQAPHGLRNTQGAWNTDHIATRGFRRGGHAARFPVCVPVTGSPERHDHGEQPSGSPSSSTFGADTGSAGTSRR